MPSFFACVMIFEPLGRSFPPSPVSKWVIVSGWKLNFKCAHTQRCEPPCWLFTYVPLPPSVWAFRAVILSFLPVFPPCSTQPPIPYLPSYICLLPTLSLFLHNHIPVAFSLSFCMLLHPIGFPSAARFPLYLPFFPAAPWTLLLYLLHSWGTVAIRKSSPGAEV